VFCASVVDDSVVDEERAAHRVAVRAAGRGAVDADEAAAVVDVVDAVDVADAAPAVAAVAVRAQARSVHLRCCKNVCRLWL
jgi:hypothetical protein